jgi:hypothetical protein
VFENRVLRRYLSQRDNRRMEKVAQWGASYFILLPKYY